MKPRAPVGWTIIARVMSNVAVKFTLAKLCLLSDFFHKSKGHYLKIFLSISRSYVTSRKIGNKIKPFLHRSNQQNLIIIFLNTFYAYFC